MKIRNGFVSNSSSSSFLVIDTEGNPSEEIPEYLTEKIYCFGSNQDTIIFPIRKATMDFGWESRRYYSIEDKLNFVVHQIFNASYDSRKQYKDMFEKVIHKHYPSYLYIQFDYNYIFWDGFRGDTDNSDYLMVDHQSSSSEGENLEMFKDEETLEKFLFCEDSYIQGGNDNSDYLEDDEYVESLKKIGKYEDYLE